MEYENEEKMAEKAPGEIYQLKDVTKDLEGAIEGVCCYFYYCYNGTYPGAKILPS